MNEKKLKKKLDSIVLTIEKICRCCKIRDCYSCNVHPIYFRKIRELID